jgi:hypothetical protein
VGWCGIQGYQQPEVHGLLQALEGRDGIRAWTAEVSLRLDGWKVDAGLPGTLRLSVSPASLVAVPNQSVASNLILTAIVAGYSLLTFLFIFFNSVVILYYTLRYRFVSRTQSDRQYTTLFRHWRCEG